VIEHRSQIVLALRDEDRLGRPQTLANVQRLGMEPLGLLRTFFRQQNSPKLGELLSDNCISPKTTATSPRFEARR
jgi:hypothetical protein